MAHFGKHTLCIVEIDGMKRRARVSDTFWLYVTGVSDKLTDTLEGTLDVTVGAPSSGSDAIGDDVTIRPEQIKALVSLIDAQELSRKYHCDWAALALEACRFNAAQGDAQWEAVLEKPYKWLEEAWLNGHDVPATIEEVNGKELVQ